MFVIVILNVSMRLLHGKVAPTPVSQADDTAVVLLAELEDAEGPRREA